MKSPISPSLLVAIVSMALFAASVANVAAQDSPMTAPNSTATVSASQTAPVQLSFSAADVLKLSRAKVSDDTIATFIQNSGLAYGLDASAIVYLRNEGVSDRVITAMLNQQQNLAAAAAQTASAQSSADANSAPYAPTYPQPSTTYVQAVPASVPASTVYVIPNSASYYYPDYSYYPYYAGYYGYGYPALSFSFGFGGYYGGRYYGGTGYRGGYYSGSGYRGGAYQGGGYAGGGYRGGGYAGGSYRGSGYAGGSFRGGGSHGGGHR